MVEKYIALSGLSEMLKVVPMQLDSLASQEALTSKEPEFDKKLLQLMKESYDKKEAAKALFNYLLENTDQKFLEEILQWLESPLAKKITKEELNSIEPARQANLSRYLTDLKLNPPTNREHRLYMAWNKQPMVLKLNQIS